MFLPEPIDVGTLASFRLGEHALHSWDVAGAFDRNAEVAPDATGLLIDLQRGIVGLASRFMPRETRPGRGDDVADRDDGAGSHVRVGARRGG